jgi:hypothetical protein
MKQSIVFELDQVRFTLVLEKLNDGRYCTSAVHSKFGRGATKTHATYKAAYRCWTRMEADALKLGWPRRVISQIDLRPPSPMLLTEDGRKLFRDSRTGEYHEDISSSRPLLLARDPVVAQPADEEDHFLIESLPRPTR